VLYLCLPWIVAAQRAHFAVDNWSRRGTKIHAGDEVRITCQSCESDPKWNWTTGALTLIETTNNGATVRVRFDKSGDVIVEALATDGSPTGDVLYLDILPKSVDCFTWKGCFTHAKSGEEDCVTSWSNYTTVSARIYLRLWVGQIDTDTGSVESTSMITENDRVLTNELYLMGERPTASIPVLPLRTLSYAPFKEFSQIGPFAEYDSAQRTWVFTFESFSEYEYFSGGVRFVEIQQIPVNSMGCGAKKQLFSVDLAKYPLATYVQGDELTNIDNTKMSIDTCNGVVFGTGNNMVSLWLYENLFSGVAVRGHAHKRPKEVKPSSAMGTVGSIAHVRNGALIVSAGAVHLLHAQHEQSVGLKAMWVAPSSSSINRVSSINTCDYMLDSNNVSMSDLAAVWDDSATDNAEYWLSTNSGADFEKQSLGSYRGTIKQVLLVVGVPYHIVLLSIPNKRWQVVLVSPTGGDLVVHTFDTLGDTAGITSALSQTGEIFVWGGNITYYSPNGGRSWRVMNLQVFDYSTLSYKTTQLTEHDRVYHIDTSIHGDIALSTVTGRIFIGKAGLVELQEIYSPFSSQPFSLFFNLDTELVGIIAPSSGIDTELVPLAKDRYRVVFPDDYVSDGTIGNAVRFTCPYWNWSSLQTDVVYADMNDNIEFTLGLTHPVELQGIGISYVSSDISRISIVPEDETLRVNAASTVIERQRTLHASVPANISAVTGPGKQYLKSGNVNLRAAPSRFNPACRAHQRNVQVHVGCPRGRHLRYAAPKKFAVPSQSVVTSACETEASLLPAGEERDSFLIECSCARYHNVTLSIATTMMRESRTKAYYSSPSTPTVDTPESSHYSDSAYSFEYEYDFERFGCPTYIPYQDHFKPTLEVWDGDRFVKEVDSDFVLYEIHGRRDVAYGVTAGVARCTRQPDSWEDKLLENNDPLKAWSFLNHQTCFVGGEDAENATWLNNPYEILNKTSANYVTFEAATVKTPLQFIATVVDPDYSFCVLQTAFAVEPYGMPVDSWTTFKVILYVVLLCLALLVGTYLYHRRDIQVAAARDRAKRNQLSLKKDK